MTKLASRLACFFFLSGISTFAEISLGANPVIIDYFNASTQHIDSIQAVRLWWRVRGAVNVDIQDGFRNLIIPSLGDENYIEVWPERTATYTLLARGSDGAIQQSSITITFPKVDPIIDFCTVTPSSINKGDVAVLQWSSRGTVRTEITGPNFFWHEHPVGSMSVSPGSSTAYNVRAYAADGRVVTCAAVVNVYDANSSPTYPYPTYPNGYGHHYPR